MSLDSSRRFFLRIVPGAIAGLVAFRAFAHAQPQGQSTNGQAIPKGSSGNGGSGAGGMVKPPAPSGTEDGTLTPSPDSTVAPPPGPRHAAHSDPPPAPKADPKLLAANQTGIKTNVKRLAELAEELKKQVEETDATKVLSLDLIKKSQEIEKLAHQIATLARG
jgi:hypothetical protein